MIERGGERAYQLVEEVGDTSVRDIRNKRNEEERPCHGVYQRFFHLIELEMFISNTLLVNPHSRNSQHPIFLLQPPCVQLAIRHNPEEYQPQSEGQQAGKQENNFPRRNSGAMTLCADGDTISDEPTQDLAPAIKAKPDVDATSLFLLGVPLRGKECEAGSNSCFEDTEAGWLVCFQVNNCVWTYKKRIAMAPG